MTAKSITLPLVAGVVLALLCGCEEEKYTLNFSHYIHVTDNGMDCDECHGEPSRPSFNAMGHETCVDCHDEPEAEEISKETCGYCHQEKEYYLMGDLITQPVKTNQSVFVHTEALADRCQDCHSGLMAKEFTSVPTMKRNEIVRIRDDAHHSGEACLTCHLDMDRDQEPMDHDHFWMKRHGMFGMQDDAACSVCHSEDSCRECHSVMQPMSHNNMWRLKTHGIEAAWDRQDCMVCHEEDSCNSCHSQASPRSHRGRWSSSGKYPTHCFGCHTSATAGEGCVVCHENGNDVMLHEPYWTPVHDRFGDQLNCYECHSPFLN